MTSPKEKKANKDDLEKGIAYFWRSINLTPRIRSFALGDGIAEVALGNHHTLLLTFNSQLLSVGENSFGQLGLGDFKARCEPTVLDFFREKCVIEIACGGHHSGVICKNSEVFFWGNSSSGQCGRGQVQMLEEPCIIDFQPNDNPPGNNESLASEQCETTRKRTIIKQIACGESHSLALSTTGEVWSWGTGCQLGQGVENEKADIPTKVDFLSGKNVTSIVCGAYHSLAIVQENRSYPTFVVCQSESVASNPEQKPKRKISRGRFRRQSKETRRKSQTSLKHEAQNGKKGVTAQPNPEKSTRTYLSYEPVTCSETIGNSYDAGISEQTTQQKENQPKEAVAERLNIDSLYDDYVDCDYPLSQIACNEMAVIRDNTSLVMSDSDEATVDNFFDISLDTAKSLPNSTESTSNILYSSTSPLFKSSPSNSGNFSFLSDSDSEQDNVMKSGVERKSEEGSLAGRISSGFYSGLTTRLIRSDVNLSKLTSAVMGSVTGIFVGSAPGQLNLRDSPEAFTSTKPCERCGLVGLCLCDSGSSKFRLTGANTQVWSWGRGGCGQLGLGDTEDRASVVESLLLSLCAGQLSLSISPSPPISRFFKYCDDSRVIATHRVAMKTFVLGSVYNKAPPAFQTPFLKLMDF
ncbi:Alsin [Acropora cervicornis]|uniref:Alsin n=1 Tax=Acropora cervicornis TaxID=6130 RepID=A0AAD9QFT0_ACRCE|nr:Alsin [Acropora cervicornis]